MKKMTEQHLINAFGGESMAHMRYLIFADQAIKENYHNVGRLFKAISNAEHIHAEDHFRELKHLKGGFVANSMATFGPQDTDKNLQLAIMGEEFEITEMYPVYIETAKFQGEKNAQRSFEWSYGTEIEHKKLFEKAFEAVKNKKNPALSTIQVCKVCGYTIEGDIPDECPLCKASREKFISY